MRKSFVIAGAILAAVAAYSTVRVAQERNVGDGPIATALRPEGPARELAFVGNSVAGTVTVIDVAARQLIGTIDVKPDGAKVGLFRNPIQSLYAQSKAEGRGGLNFAQDTDVSPDGRVLYVSRGNLADVVAFDLASGGMLWRTSIGHGRSDHMALTPDGRYLFVSDLIAARVRRIDTRTGRLDGEFVSGVFPHDIQFSADGRRVYNASLGDMSVDEKDRDAIQPSADSGFAYQITVADVKTLAPIDVYRFPRGIRPFHLSPDGRSIYAQLSNTHDVVRYDVGQKKIVETLHLPVNPGVTPDDWDFQAPHHGLAMTRDGRLLCIAGRASDYAGIVSTGPLKLVAAVPVADAPSWAVIDHAEEVCLTADTRADRLSFVSLAERREIARLPTGRGAKHITLADVPVGIIASIKARSSSARRK